MTLEEHFNKQNYFDHWDYVGEIDTVKLYVYYRKADENACTGFPHFVTDDNGRISDVTSFDKILDYNAFYNDSFSDDDQEECE